MAKGRRPTRNKLKKIKLTIKVIKKSISRPNCWQKEQKQLSL
jgi:hypothetical protein